MALGLNHALLIGTLVRDPDLRYTPAGLAVLRLDLGGDDQDRDEEGGPRTRPWYQRATVFGAQAERVADALHAGTPVWLEGHLEQRRWQDAEGRSRSTLEVVGRRVEVLEYGLRDEEDAVALDARDQPRLRDARNQVRLIGNLVRDVEVRRSDEGATLARFSLAVRDRGGTDETTPHFVDVRAWRSLAEGVDGATRGTPLYLEGRLVSDAWTDPAGERRRATRVEATRIEVVRRGVADAAAVTRGTGASSEGADEGVAAVPF
jgi:single-strand DNA-binding protein